MLVLAIAAGAAVISLVPGTPGQGPGSTTITAGPAGMYLPRWGATSWKQLDDPSRDGWQTEVIAHQVDQQLGKLAALLARKDQLDESGLVALASGQFSCGPLEGTDLQTVLADSAIEVRRAVPDQSATAASGHLYRGPAGLAQALKRFLQPFAEASDLRCEFEVVGMDASADALITRQYLSISGRTNQGMLQQNASWETGWVMEGAGGADPLPRLVSIAVDHFEQVRTSGLSGPLYADCTQSALSRNESYRVQLLRGYDYWLRRTESRSYGELLGTPGLAIGDVNGDGLDDLYLCQEKGLPNLLLVQTQDGTLQDVSRMSGVDWLDDSRSALLIDLDNDADQDLAVGVCGGVALAENDGSGRFVLRTVLPTSDDVKSLVAADYDGDAQVDLYVTAYYPNVFVGPADSSGMAAAQPDMLLFDANGGGANSLYQNQINGGDWQFADVTVQVGLNSNNDRYSLSAAWEDFDNDGDVDLYVANDCGRNNLYRNDGGTFVDVAPQAGVEDFAFANSATWGDFDGNGWMDVYVGNTYSAAGKRVSFQQRFKPGATPDERQRYQHLARGNTLFQNAGDGHFLDVSQNTAVAAGRWAWSSNFVDLNNDGWEDLVVANGLITTEDSGDCDSYFWRQLVASAGDEIHDIGADELPDLGGQLLRMLSEGRSFAGRQRNCCFLNTGGNSPDENRFADFSAASGLDQLDDGRAIGRVDWDQDGDVDLWMSNRTAPRLRLMRNDSPAGNHFLSLRLVGDGRTSSRDAIGARVEIIPAQPRTPDQPRTVRTLRAGEGFIGQSSKWLHFGLGQVESIEAVLVHWPSADAGAPERFTVSQVDRRYELVQGTGSARPASGLARTLSLEPGVPETLPASDVARIPLCTLLPVPELRYEDFDGRQLVRAPLGQPVLVMLCAAACGTCQAELLQMAQQAEAIRGSGIDVLVLWVDAITDYRDPLAVPGDLQAARQLVSDTEFPFACGIASTVLVQQLQSLHDYLVPIDSPLPIPTSFLVDGQGKLAVIYKGPVSISQLIQDKDHSLTSPQERFQLCGALAGSVLASEPTAAAAVRQEAALRTLAARDLQQRGLEDQAVAHYRELLKIRPEDYDAQYFVGKNRYDRGDLPLAKDHLQEALRLLPDNADAHALLADVLVRLGNPAEAIKHCEEAVRLKPEQAEFRVNLGNVLLNQGQYAAAKVQYEEALRRKPDFAEANNALGTAWFLDGDLAKAKEYYEHALRINSEYAEAHFNLGNVLARRGSLHQAKGHFEQALRIRPDYREAQANLSRLNTLIIRGGGN